jgi:hypothetical protein
LLRGNIKNLSTASVTADTLRTQKNELAKAENKLRRLEQQVFQSQDKVRQLRALLTETRLRHKEKNTPQSKRACESVANKLSNAIQRRDERVSQFRDMKQIVRDQQAMCRKLERKEAAKQKAVAQFLKKWERDYDREIRLREKKARQRRRWLKGD